MSDDLPTRAEDEAGLINAVVVGVGVCTFGLPPSILIYQAYHWLKDGFWTPISIEYAMMSGGFAIPYTDWRGVQHIIDWVVALPLGLGILVSGVGIAALIMPLHRRAQDRLDAERSNRARAQRLR